MRATTSGSFSTSCSRARHKPEVHPIDLDQAVCALVQIVRIFADADFVTTLPPMRDHEVESLSAYIIQDLIFNFNQKKMDRHVAAWRNLRPKPVPGTKDYDCDHEAEDD